MAMRLPNLLHHDHQHRCYSSDSHDCWFISRKRAILITQQCRRSSFKQLHSTTVPAAARLMKAPVTSLSSSSNSAVSAIKKNGAGAKPPPQVSPPSAIEKECGDTTKDAVSTVYIDSGRSNIGKELGHFLKLINRSCKSRNCDEGLYFLKRMVSAGHFPDVVLCTKLIKGFISSVSSTDQSAAAPRRETSAVSKAQEVMEILENHGSPDVFAYNALLTVICKENKSSSAKHMMESGIAVLDRIKAHGCSPDIITYNILIGALCDKHRLDLAMEVLDRLLQENECQPTVVTYTILIEAIIMDMSDDSENGKGKGGGITRAMELLEEMAAKGLQPDNYTYNAILRGMCKRGLLDQAWQLIRTLSRTAGNSTAISRPTPAPDVISYNILLRSLLAMRRWEDAEKLISEMVSTGHCRPNVVTHSILVSSLCQQGMTDKAIKVLDDMMTQGLKPDTYSYDPIISTYCKQGRMDLAIAFMERILSCGYVPDIVNYNTILASLCKNGAAHQALEVLDKLEELGCRPNTSSYNAVIGGLWNSGDRTKALKALSQMTDKGIHPDEVTYNALISCLCRDGMVDHAIQLMADMEETWGYLPTIITYNTIILGLCKVHRINDAIGALEIMIGRGRCRPNESTYVILVEGLAYAGYGDEAAEVGTALISCNAISRDSIRRLKKTFPNGVPTS